jgi:hypothetical protein
MSQEHPAQRPEDAKKKIFLRGKVNQGEGRRMVKTIFCLTFIVFLAGFAWADPSKGTIPKGIPPKVGPAHPQFRGDFVPGKRARLPNSYHGVKRPMPKRLARARHK